MDQELADAARAQCTHQVAARST